MNKRIILIGLIVLLAGVTVFLLTGDLGQTTAPDQPSVQETTQPQMTEEETPLAPDFTVYDLEGNKVHLSDYIGKPVVLNFWASWCGPCKREMPDFQEKYLELGDRVQFLMINLTDGTSETVQSASGFIVAQGYSFPVLFDRDSHAARTYGIRSIPTTIFIDAQGRAVAQATGTIDGETLQKGIDMILEP